ncbi:MAG: DUF1788 domain-containing protein [Gammaproteobacteria bacterium]|jgi:hypothetical protein|nr:DUF1788 domain-containing protein [Gammaproteobacteria bacterium]
MSDPDIATRPIAARLTHLVDVISGERFLQKQGLGNEVPFFICPFDPQEAVEMDRLQRLLIKQLERKAVSALEINLYDLSIELLHEREIWDRILEVETEVSKPELLELLQGVLDPEEHLVPAIARKMQGQAFQVMLINGVGEVYPYIRSHNVLNNLQRIAQDKPTVMFFPGAYTQSLESGASLDLFGRLHDDKYYRAFNIYDYQA